MTELKLRSKDLRNHYYRSEINIFSKGLLSQESLIRDLLEGGIDFQRLVKQIADRRSRDELVDLNFAEYQEYLNYKKSDYSKIYSLALIAVYRCWHRCTEVSRWPESAANLFLTLQDLQEYVSRVQGYRVEWRGYAKPELPRQDLETRKSHLSELISAFKLEDFIKMKVSSQDELVSRLKELSPSARASVFHRVSHHFWDFEKSSPNGHNISGVRMDISQTKDRALHRVSEAKKELSKAYFFKGRHKKNILDLNGEVHYFEKLELIFNLTFPPERERSLNQDYKIFKRLVEEKKWEAKIDAIFRVIEILEYAEQKIDYEKIIVLEERKRSMDQAFIDGYMRKVRREIKRAFP